MWLGFEQRWREALVGAVLPGTRTDAAFWDAFLGAAPPLLRLGLRASVWALALGPLGWRLRTFPRLSADEQDAWLAAAADHRWYPVRQLVVSIELAAAFARFRERPAPSEPS